MVCKLEWVQGVWDDGADVSQDQAFKALHHCRLCVLQSFRQVTLAFLGTLNPIRKPFVASSSSSIDYCVTMDTPAVFKVKSLDCYI